MTQVLPRRTPSARPYLTLLLLLPAAAAIWFGWNRYSHVAPGGTVDAVKITTKQGFVGQAAEAVANAKPQTPDLYIQVIPKTGEKIVMPAFKNTPVGNGLTWNLPRSLDLAEIDRVEIWDHNSIWKDSEFDRVNIEHAWEADGQQFHVQLQGKKIEPPPWAMPTLAGGAVAAGLVVLKFVWDQVV